MNTIHLLLLFLLLICSELQAQNGLKKQAIVCPKVAYTSQKGNIPLLLTNEHGADNSHLIEGIAHRQGIGVKRFVTLADQYTDQITFEIAQHIEHISQKRPFLLIAEIPRKQIDFNRPPELAYESELLKPCYDDFHRQANFLVNLIKQKWGYGYLLDVHGQSRFPKKLIRGTRNGLSIQQLRKREGNQQYLSSDGLFGMLATKGYVIAPKKGKPETVYQGGYMLKKYGSQHERGLDAIQIEIGRHYRDTPEERRQIARDIAKALILRFETIFH